MPPPALALVARPTIRLNGGESERLTSQLLGMVMSEREGGLSSLELQLSNSASLRTGLAEYAFDAGGELDFGQEIVVGAGDSRRPIEIFRGRITGIEGVFSERAPPELIVLAEDALQPLRFRRRSRTFENHSLAEIARLIASDHGLSPVIDRLDDNFGPQVQLDETDLGFLRRLLARVDGDIQVVGQELHVSRRADVRRGTLTLTLGQELQSARVLADLAHQVTGSTARGWDIAAGQEISADGPGHAPSPGQGRTGAEHLRSAFSARTDLVCHPSNDSQAEAEAVAAATEAERARRFVRVLGTSVGKPELRVGTQVTLAGLGSWFSTTTYYTTAVRHRFDAEHGYRTEFEATSAFLGAS
jgi:hypothetical protein